MHQNKKQIIISSLVSIFLVSTLVITSTLITNPQFSLDIRNYAKEVADVDIRQFVKKQDSPAPPKKSISAPRTSVTTKVKEEIETILSNPAPTPVTKVTTRTEKDEDIDGNTLITHVTTTNTTSTNPQTGQTTQTTTVSETSVNTPSVTNTVERIKTTNQDNTESVVTNSTTSKTSTELEKTDEGFITHETTITTDNTTGAIVADKTNTTSTIKDTTTTVEKTDEGFIRTNTTTTRDANTGTIVDAFSVTTTPSPKPIPTPTQTKVVQTEPTSIWNTIADKLNNSQELSGLGTYGLGGGNAPVVTPPVSVITSENPQDSVDFYKGVAYSIGAGAGTAGTILAGGLLSAPVVGQAAYSYGSAALTSTLSSLPTAVQTGITTVGSAATLAAPYLATRECIKSNDPGSPACVGLVTGYQANPVEFNQALSDSANTLITKPLNNLLDNTVFTGLTGNNPNLQTGDQGWGGGFGTYGGQTLISRSNMPANLTPQEQSLWLAKADVVENWNYYYTYGSPSRYTNVGYQPNAAVELYQPSNINQALENIPDPLGIINNLEQQSGLGSSPSEILANSRSYLENNGIIIIETPPPKEQWWVNTPNGQGTYWNSQLSEPLSNSTTFGIYRGQNDAIAISVDGTKFAFPGNSNYPLPYTPYEGDAILLNRPALNTIGPSKELQTVIHEAGHAVESSYMPQVTSNFWYKNQDTGKWMVSQETGAAATEYISTLYGIKAAQSLAPTSINMAIDTMTYQLLLNTNIVNLSPSYLLP